MQSNASVFRTGPILQEGVEKLEALADELETVKVILEVFILVKGFFF